MHSSEGMMHQETLAMVYYGIGFLPLTKHMKDAYPEIT